MPEFSNFDQRRYPTVPVREGYGAWTPTYESTVQDIMDLALLERIESVDWKGVQRAADLGCGTGRTGAWLATRGDMRIDGVDVTPEMIELARAKGLFERLVVADVQDSGLPGATYELVTCSLVDEHLPALDGLYGEAARLLCPGGSFVLVGFHPFFIMSSGMPTHFDHPERGPVALETHVHLLSEHAQAARAVGLTSVELHERVVDEEWIRRKPKWERHRDWPVSFAWVWRAAR